MSVVEPQRHKGRLEVHVKAQDLAVYTSRILSNSKRFNPEIDPELISRIRGCAYDIYARSWSANKIRADANIANRCIRYSIQEEAIVLCDDMLTYIGIAKKVFHVSGKRIKYWSGLRMA